MNLSLVIFGDNDAPVEAIDDALGAVDGYLDTLTEAAEVPAVFNPRRRGRPARIIRQSHYVREDLVGRAGRLGGPVPRP